MVRRTLPIAAMSTKAYFGVHQTLDWLAEVAAAPALSQRVDVEVALFPSFPVLGQMDALLAGSTLAWGGQDVAPSGDGAQTGEVTATMLAECGCRYAEVGHAERRAAFGDDAERIPRKISACAGAGLVPLLCVGEPSRGDSTSAADFCTAQLRQALVDGVTEEVLVAYEPVWAIGAAHPADTGHVRYVCGALRGELDALGVAGRVMYGGTAGRGLIENLVPDVDGLFLGRRAHDVHAFVDIVDEVAHVLGQ